MLYLELICYSNDLDFGRFSGLNQLTKPSEFDEKIVEVIGMFEKLDLASELELLLNMLQLDNKDRIDSDKLLQKIQNSNFKDSDSQQQTAKLHKLQSGTALLEKTLTKTTFKFDRDVSSKAGYLQTVIFMIKYRLD